MVSKRRFSRWILRAPLERVGILGAVLYWLLGTAVFCGPFAEWNEPYSGWSGSKSSMVPVALAAAFVSAVWFVPLASAPLFVAAFRSWRAKRRDISPPDFSALRVWLIAPWRVVLVACLLAPLCMVKVSVDQAMPDASDHAPAWTSWLPVQRLGHPSLSILLTIAALLVASIAAARRVPTVAPRRGNKCRKCDYSLLGISKNTPCPECGCANTRDELLVVSSSPRRFSIFVITLNILIGTAVASLIVYATLGDWRLFSPQHAKAWQLCVVVATCTIWSLYITRFAATKPRIREGLNRFLLPMLWAIVACLVWLGIVEIAHWIFHIALPTASPRRNPLRFFDNSTAYFLAPVLIVFCWSWWLCVSLTKPVRFASDAHHT